MQSQPTPPSPPPGWRTRTPAYLSELADLVAQVLARDGDIDAERAELLGYAVMYAYCETFGGVQVYVPKADSLALCEKHAQIWAEFNGKNQAELARKYRISQVHVYRIIKAERARARAQQQGELAL